MLLKRILVTTLTIVSISYPLFTPDAGFTFESGFEQARKLQENPHNFDLNIYGSQIQVRIEQDWPKSWRIKHEDVVGWVKDAVYSIAKYYGKFPLQKTIIRVKQTSGSGVGFATASYDEAGRQGQIDVNLGKYTESHQLKDTWTLTHEMVHLTFPLVNDRYNWLTEGIATYVEPIGRMRQGLISKEKMWRDLVTGLPQGQPQPGDRGLNRTHSWGRTYWGGALFCFVADVRLRSETNNRCGLEEALKGIMNSGATAESNLLYAPNILKLGDQATKTTVLSELYDQMKDTPVGINLPYLWKQLGVSLQGDRVIFNDQAPLSRIRKSIERG